MCSMVKKEFPGSRSNALWFRGCHLLFDIPLACWMISLVMTDGALIEMHTVAYTLLFVAFTGCTLSQT
jgi:hypothetical protein